MDIPMQYVTSFSHCRQAERAADRIESYDPTVKATVAEQTSMRDWPVPRWHVFVAKKGVR